MNAHTPKCVGPPGANGHPQNERMQAQAGEALKRLERGVLAAQPEFTGVLGVQISYVNGYARSVKGSAALDGLGGT